MFLFRDKTFDDNNIIIVVSKVMGISWSRARIIISRIGLNIRCSTIDVNEYVFNMISSLLRRFVISEVRILRRIRLNIIKLIDNKTYRGIRHRLCSPTRGQRTRTNARTQRAKRSLYKDLLPTVSSSVIKSKKIVKKKK